MRRKPTYTLRNLWLRINITLRRGQLSTFGALKRNFPCLVARLEQHQGTLLDILKTNAKRASKMVDSFLEVVEQMKKQSIRQSSLRRTKTPHFTELMKQINEGSGATQRSRSSEKKAAR